METMVPSTDAMELDDASQGNHAQGDSDWEYEYEEEETEDFYVTLDLTSHVAPIARNRKNQRTTEEASGATPSQNTPAPLEEHDTNTPLSSIVKPDTTDRMQILGLHSSKPIISFHNKLYTCHWASPIGTDILFHLPPKTQSPDDRPSHSSIHSTPDFSVLAASSLRLIAKPAKILPKASEIPTSQEQQKQKAQPQTAAATNTAEIEAAATTTPHFATQTMRAKQSQLTFLTALAALKSSRGNPDAVPMGRGAELVPNDGDGASSESEESYTDIDDDGVTGGTGRRRGGGRGSRGRSNAGVRRALGGLFRDYRPAPGDTAGADIRSSGENLRLGEVLENPAPARGSRGGRLRASGGHGRGRGRGRGNGRGKWRKNGVQAGERGGLQNVADRGFVEEAVLPNGGERLAFGETVLDEPAMHHALDPALGDHDVAVEEGGGQAGSTGVKGGDGESMQVDT